MEDRRGAEVGGRCSAFDGDCAAHECHESCGNGQSEAGSAVLACGAGVHLREFFENSGQPVFRNPWARVRYGDGECDVLCRFAFDACMD